MMKKLIKRLAVYLIKLAYKGKYQEEIREELRKIAKDIYITNKRIEFKISESIIQVKKGQRKYHVAYFETNTGKTKATISRHIEKKTKEIVIN